MNRAVLVSIVIPTHNRSRYAMHAIANVLSIPSDEIQLVVHDSSDDDALEQWVVAREEDHRLTYRHVHDLLSMTDNHNAGVALAVGDYVCLIGDDDGVTPEIIEAARWAKAHNVDALTPRLAAVYCWPDFRTRLLGDRHAARLYIGKFSGVMRVADVRKALKDCLRQACQEPGDLPKIYHGIVRRTCLEAVRKAAGAYFFGVSPDVSGAVALAPRILRHVIVDYPLTIPGASGGSNTGRSAMQTHKGSLSDDPHMRRFAQVVWPDLVPRFFSVETVWAQAGLEALRLTQQDVHIKEFDYTKLHAMCLWSHPEYAPTILRNFYGVTKARRGNLAAGLGSLLVGLGKVAGTRFAYWVKRLAHPTAGGGRDVIENVPNIEASGRALQTYLSRKGRSLSSLLTRAGEIDMPALVRPKDRN